MAEKKKFAVILAGSGVFDGAEIHEATMTLYAIAKHGAEYEIFAPDIPQHHVINHLTGKEMNESRNVLVEAARIARGKIKPLSDFDAAAFDVLIFPGGFGVAKNLSTFAFDGSKCTVNKEVELAVKAMIEAGKPIGALCIAPAMIAKIVEGVEVTVGKDEGTAEAIKAMGGTHITAGHGEVVVDKKFKIASTPCYMLNATIIDIANDADNIVKKLLELL